MSNNVIKSYYLLLFRIQGRQESPRPVDTDGSEPLDTPATPGNASIPAVPRPCYSCAFLDYHLFQLEVYTDCLQAFDLHFAAADFGERALWS